MYFLFHARFCERFKKNSVTDVLFRTIKFTMVYIFNENISLCFYSDIFIDVNSWVHIEHFSLITFV